MPRNFKSLRTQRRGSVLVEGAFTLPIFLIIICGMMDLGLAVLQQNTLAVQARYAAREAIVHGADAPPQRTEWRSAAEAEAAIYLLIHHNLAMSAIRLETVNVQVLYQQDENGNDINLRNYPVTVTVTAEYRPLTPFLRNSGISSIPLASTSQMIIAN